jgi:chromosome segregation ATPase
MLKLFSGNKKNKELEAIIAQLESNMANNYKDAAQSDYRLLGEKYSEMVGSNKLSSKQIDYYKNLIEEYKEKLNKYSHKDQKPYWTK